MVISCAAEDSVSVSPVNLLLSVAQNTDVMPNILANNFELNEQGSVVSGILFSVSLYRHVLSVNAKTGLSRILLVAVISSSPDKDESSIIVAMGSCVDEYLSHLCKSASIVSMSSSL